jgi:dTMP kinase
MGGVFITLEGVEGAGKTTQARMLAEALRARGHEVVATREPGGTAIGTRIREVLLAPEHGAMDAVTELLLYAAARRQHVAELIQPALRRGAIVLCDRFSDSTRAYQGEGRGLPMETIEALDAIATRGLAPDLTLLLDVSPEVGLARNHSACKHDRIEAESLAFHTRVREGFLALQRAHPERIVLIPSSSETLKTHERILETVLSHLE